jgi:GT2 family glycosyltransferase
MTDCEMIKTTRRVTAMGGGNAVIGRGGNTTGPRRIIVRRNAALGDVLSASVVCDKLIEQGHDVIYQCHPSAHCIFRYHPKIRNVTGLDVNPDVNLDNAYETHPLRRKMHFNDIWMGKTNEQLQRFGINLGPAFNCKPQLRIHPTLKNAALERFRAYPRPWVFIVPRSDTFACRTVPDHIWSEACASIPGTKFWMGRNRAAPANCVDLQVQHFDNVIMWLSVADLLVTVDTGPMHVAAALNVPLVVIGQAHSPDLHLGDQSDFVTIWPSGLDCLNCQKHFCPINQAEPPCQRISPGLVSAWATSKLGQKDREDIAAIIPIYQPDANVLNRCLESVLPQVQQVIICEEGGKSRWPQGVLSNPKIRRVVKGLSGIGYARNVNFGARHSTAKYLLILNDDVFLNPDAVKKMKDVCKPGVGAVAGKLWYPDGTLYHAGKFRKPGERGWGHVDLRARKGSIEEPGEMENVNGAALFMPREAFYKIGGFDEEYFGYCSDDDTCLRLRQYGYKIIYQPHAEGIHSEGQSMIKVSPMRTDLIAAGSRTFERKWKHWWDRNLQTVPGNNF